MVFLSTSSRLLFAAAATLGLSVAPTQAQAPALEKTELRYQGWAGEVTFPELAEDLGYIAPLKLKWIGSTISGLQDVQSAATGEIDFGGAFYGAIAKLAASRAPIKVVVGYYGTDKNTYNGFLVKEDSPLKGPRDRGPCQSSACRRPSG